MVMVLSGAEVSAINCHNCRVFSRGMPQIVSTCSMV